MFQGLTANDVVEGLVGERQVFYVSNAGGEPVHLDLLRTGGQKVYPYPTYRP